MTQPKHLSRAPIVEAVIDFRATASADFDVSVLGSLENQIGAYITGFLTQMQIQDPDTLVAGTIIQRIQPGVTEPGTVPVILDLDIYEAGVRSPDPSTLLARFETLRKIKNKYFFASITQKTLELFI